MKTHEDGEANWKSLFSYKNGEITQVITKKRSHKKNERFTVAYLQVSVKSIFLNIRLNYLKLIDCFFHSRKNLPKKK